MALVSCTFGVVMRVAVGSDHRGFQTVSALVQHLKADGHDVEVVSDCGGAMCDYPDVAYQVARAVADGQADRGILMCGTGIGMCIAANKLPGVRAAIAHDELTAEISRTHNDANVLCLSADLLGQRLIEKIVDTWLATPFQGGRHARRIQEIQAIEAGKDPADKA